jgi:glycine cleavage system transcriptional repressor
MHRLAVTAVGGDRPGIVAAVVGVFFDLGCNLGDCTMTLLEGQFAMIMCVEAPDHLRSEALERALAGPAGDLDLSILVTPADNPGPATAGRPYVVSLYGADRPGLVFSVTRHLAQRAANVTDLMSHLTSAGVYTMVLDIDLPPDLDAGALEAELASIARDLGVEIHFRQAESDEL